VDKKRSKVLRDNAFRDVNRYEPERVQVTRRKHGAAAAEKMKAGIALDTARRQGVRIPRKK
jgi:hypothetical protein